MWFIRLSCLLVVYYLCRQQLQCFQPSKMAERYTAHGHYPLLIDTSKQKKRRVSFQYNLGEGCFGFNIGTHVIKYGMKVQLNIVHDNYPRQRNMNKKREKREKIIHLDFME